MPAPNTHESIFDRVQVGAPDQCWPWTGTIGKDGYGEVSYHRRIVIVHRFVYELAVEPVDRSLDLDHLCRNRACCNPDHLEPVTRRVNVLRGVGVGAVNAAKTECVNGHLFDAENTRWTTSRGGYPSRVCRACTRDAVRRYQQRRSE